MGFDQYHEPPEELPQATRTFARMLTSLIEEAEAIGWYEQRIAVEKDAQAVAIMKNAQHEEMKHFGMDLEFLLRQSRSGATCFREFSSRRATSSSTATQRRKQAKIDRSFGRSSRVDPAVRGAV